MTHTNTAASNKSPVISKTLFFLPPPLAIATSFFHSHKWQMWHDGSKLCTLYNNNFHTYKAIDFI